MAVNKPLPATPGISGPDEYTLAYKERPSTTPHRSSKYSSKELAKRYSVALKLEADGDEYASSKASNRQPSSQRSSRQLGGGGKSQQQGQKKYKYPTVQPTYYNARITPMRSNSSLPLVYYPGEFQGVPITDAPETPLTQVLRKTENPAVSVSRPGTARSKRVSRRMSTRVKARNSARLSMIEAKKERPSTAKQASESDIKAIESAGKESKEDEPKLRRPRALRHSSERTLVSGSSEEKQAAGDASADSMGGLDGAQRHSDELVLARRDAVAAEQPKRKARPATSHQYRQSSAAKAAAATDTASCAAGTITATTTATTDVGADVTSCMPSVSSVHRLPVSSEETASPARRPATASDGVPLARRPNTASVTASPARRPATAADPMPTTRGPAKPADPVPSPVMPPVPSVRRPATSTTVPETYSNGGKSNSRPVTTGQLANAQRKRPVTAAPSQRKGSSRSRPVTSQAAPPARPRTAMQQKHSRRYSEWRDIHAQSLNRVDSILREAVGLDTTRGPAGRWSTYVPQTEAENGLGITTVTAQEDQGRQKARRSSQARPKTSEAMLTSSLKQRAAMMLPSLESMGMPDPSLGGVTGTARPITSDADLGTSESQRRPAKKGAVERGASMYAPQTRRPATAHDGSRRMMSMYNPSMRTLPLSRDESRRTRLFAEYQKLVARPDDDEDDDEDEEAVTARSRVSGAQGEEEEEPVAATASSSAIANIDNEEYSGRKAMDHSTDKPRPSTVYARTSRNEQQDQEQPTPRRRGHVHSVSMSETGDIFSKKRSEKRWTRMLNQNQHLFGQQDLEVMDASAVTNPAAVTNADDDADVEEEKEGLPKRPSADSAVAISESESDNDEGPVATNVSDGEAPVDLDALAQAAADMAIAESRSAEVISLASGIESDSDDAAESDDGGDGCSDGESMIAVVERARPAAAQALKLHLDLSSISATPPPMLDLPPAVDLFRDVTEALAQRIPGSATSTDSQSSTVGSRPARSAVSRPMTAMPLYSPSAFSAFGVNIFGKRDPLDVRPNTARNSMTESTRLALVSDDVATKRGSIYISHDSVDVEAILASEGLPYQQECMSAENVHDPSVEDTDEAVLEAVLEAESVSAMLLAANDTRDNADTADAVASAPVVSSSAPADSSSPYSSPVSTSAAPVFSPPPPPAAAAAPIVAPPNVYTRPITISRPAPLVPHPLSYSASPGPSSLPTFAMIPETVYEESEDAELLAQQLAESEATNTDSTPTIAASHPPLSPSSNDSNKKSGSLARHSEHVRQQLQLVEDATSASALGQELSKADDAHREMLAAYMKRFDFQDQPIDFALRQLFQELHLPAESQQIDRVITSFAARYHACNPGLFLSAEVVYAHAFAILLLHTDAHNPRVKQKMTKAQFIARAKLLDDGEMFDEVLDILYDNVTMVRFEYAPGSEMAKQQQQQQQQRAEVPKDGGGISGWLRRMFAPAAVTSAPVQSPVPLSPRDMPSKQQYSYSSLPRNIQAVSPVVPVTSPPAFTAADIPVSTQPLAVETIRLSNSTYA
ncbi:hypothetical protein GGI07_003918 [Coemansia sp. Benny D115]|nr:hypothetical protein GGI07_003918 [Coemansia sp. Benny D115]